MGNTQNGDVCSIIKEWKVEFLQTRKYVLGWNECSKILQQIKEVIFPCIQTINIEGNEIDSMEGFNRIHLPLLERL